MIDNDILDKMIETIKNNYQTDKIILFGSYARNEQKEESDVDILVISDSEKNLPRYKRGLKLRVLLSNYQIPKDILFYTKEEVEEWKNTPNSFIYNVLEEGKVLYG
jgi:uncharacterized protein